MNAAATLSLVSVLAALFVGLLTRRVALAPGSGEQRWFALVVLASAAYSLFDLPTTVPGPPRLVFLIAGFAVGTITVSLWAWIRFSQELVGATPGRLERAVSRGLLLALPGMAIPGVLFTGEVVERPYPPLGAVYRQAATTLAGDVAFAILFVIGLAVLVRLARAWRRGTRHAGAIAASYATMLAFALSDALAVSLDLPLPFLLDWGFAAPVLAVGWMNTSRLVEAARGLEQLRAGLVTEIEARTRALSSTLESLHQAEKLAALGQFARGVAHEVNSPAAVVSAGLRFLADSREVHLVGEEAEALADARSAMEQITRLVRKLLDASMVVGRPGDGTADVPATIAKVIAALSHPVREALDVRTAGARGARVRLSPEALELVLETLLRNAVDATPAGAAESIAVGAERRDGRVRVTVSDPGPGMSATVLRHAFEPFFTTKPLGRGTGLGLAVARGLVHGGGGTLALESAPGRGTRAVVELPEADPAPDAAGGPDPDRRPADRDGPTRGRG